MIFETARLSLRKLTFSDEGNFFDMMGNPNVMNPVPVKTLNKEESDAKLSELIEMEQGSPIQIWAVTEKGKTELIGMAGFLKNNEEENELAYRFREDYWGIGYGTEAAKGLIEYGFSQLNFDLLTADVNITNIRSAKILDKFLIPHREFFNPKDNCTDRRYKLSRENWLTRLSN